jgi:hypothetical protein
MNYCIKRTSLQTSQQRLSPYHFNILVEDRTRRRGERQYINRKLDSKTSTSVHIKSPMYVAWQWSMCYWIGLAPARLFWCEFFECELVLGKALHHDSVTEITTQQHHDGGGRLRINQFSELSSKAERHPGA